MLFKRICSFPKSCRVLRWGLHDKSRASDGTRPCSQRLNFACDLSPQLIDFIPSSPRQLDALTCLYPIFPLKHWNWVHTIDGIYLGRTSQTLDDLNGVIQKNGQLDSENRVSTTFDDSSSFSAWWWYMIIIHDFTWLKNEKCMMTYDYTIHIYTG